MSTRFVASVDGQDQAVEVAGGGGQYRVTVGDQVWEVDARRTAHGVYSLLVGGVSYVADITPREGGTLVEVNGERYLVQVSEASRHALRGPAGAAASQRGQTLKAPMPGRITHVAVRAGDTVEPGAPLMVIEAMKMENEFRAAAAGTVAEVRVEVGQAVNAGDVLVVIRPA